MKPTKLFVVFLFSLCFSIPVIAQDNKQAIVQITGDNPHFHGGDEVSFKFKLNDPLPDGARFEVRLSPTGVGQQFPVSSGEPVDPEDRKEFLMKFKLPEHAYAGEWHIVVTYLFLPGVSWTQSTISTNDLKFTVDGPKEELPTTATATIVSK